MASWPATQRGYGGNAGNGDCGVGADGVHVRVGSSAAARAVSDADGGARALVVGRAWRRPRHSFRAGSSGPQLPPFDPYATQPPGFFRTAEFSAAGPVRRSAGFSAGRA